MIAVTTEHGYHGCRATFELYKQIRGAEHVSIVDLEDDFAKHSKDGRKLLVWLETPLNPTGASRSIAACTIFSLASASLFP